MSLRINFALSYFSVSIILGVISIGLYVFLPAFRATLGFAVILTGACATSCAAGYAAYQLHTVSEQAHMKSSFDLLRNLGDADYDPVWSELEGLEKPEDVKAKLAEDKKLRTGAFALLGRFENVALAIKCGYVNERLVFYSLGYLVPTLFRKMRLMVDDDRIKYNDNTIFVQVELLSTAWGQGQSMLSHKPFPSDASPW